MEKAPGRILVVDDDAALLKMLSLHFARQEYAVTTADSREEAWEAFAAAPGDFALALLDCTMPGCTMEDLAIRMLRANPGLRVIACSGYPVDMTAVEAVAPGQVMFLQKPFTSGTLSEMVQGLLAAEVEKR